MSITTINNQYLNTFNVSVAQEANQTTEEAVEETTSVQTASTSQLQTPVDTYESSASSAQSLTIDDVTYSYIKDIISENEKSNASAVTSSLTASTSSSSEDEEDEVTETVVKPDGSVYLKTTTTDADGNETVTMQKISDATVTDENQNSDFQKDATAQALQATFSALA